jgi:multidrug efflux pump subunit AcrA (membrane-fusion protein)
MGKWVLVPVSLLVVILGSTIAYFGLHGDRDEQVSTVRRETMSRMARGTGKVEGLNEPANLAFGIPGRLGAVAVQEGQQVKQGEVLAELDATALDLEIELARSALKEALAREKRVAGKPRVQELSQLEVRRKQAEVAVSSLELRLRQLEDPETPPQPPASDIKVATLKANRAIYQYNLSVHKENKLLAGPLPHDVAVAERRLDIANTEEETSKKLLNAVLEGKYKSYSSAGTEYEKINFEGKHDKAAKEAAFYQAEFDRVKRGPLESEKKTVEAERLMAGTDQEIAKAELDRLKAPPKPPRAAESEIALARLELQRTQSVQREAEAALELLKAGPRPEDLEAAHAAVEHAAGALALAQARRKEATLVAPFDGTVIARHCEPGGSPAPFSPVLTLADTKHIRVRAELDVRFSPEIQVGQTVKLDNRALFREPLTGKIRKVKELVGPKSLFSLDPSELKGGEVTTVLIELDASKSEGEKSSQQALRPGLRLDAEINFETRENVLSVPRNFVATKNGKYVVYKAESASLGRDGQHTPVEVQLGLRDGINVEILSGVLEGDFLVKPAKKPE